MALGTQLLPQRGRPILSPSLPTGPIFKNRGAEAPRVYAALAGSHGGLRVQPPRLLLLPEGAGGARAAVLSLAGLLSWPCGGTTSPRPAPHLWISALTRQTPAGTRPCQSSLRRAASFPWPSSRGHPGLSPIPASPSIPGLSLHPGLYPILTSPPSRPLPYPGLSLHPGLSPILASTHLSVPHVTHVRHREARVCLSRWRCPWPGGTCALGVLLCMGLMTLQSHTLHGAEAARPRDAP